MTSAEPLPLKDFYLDIGRRDGLKEGDLVTVVREFPVLNQATGQPTQLMKIPLGQLKVVALGASHCFARIQEARPPSELPAMESFSIMVGDEVELVSPSKSELQRN